MGEVTILHLTRAARAAHLLHCLNVERPSLHVRFGQMAARCIGWIAPTDREMTLRNKGTTLTDAAVAKSLQGEKHCGGKIIVDHQRRDIIVNQPSHAEAVCRRLNCRRAPEIVGWKC